MLFQYCKVFGLASPLAALVAMACAGTAAAAEPPACHGTPTPYKLVVTAQGVRNNHGYVVANLYGSDKHRWLADNGELSVAREPADRGEVAICLYLPSPGRYAVVIFHDANGDGDLNMGPLGPKEAFGFSNNVRPFLAPPMLRSALFDAGLGVTRISIRLRYPPVL